MDLNRKVDAITANICDGQNIWDVKTRDGWEDEERL